MCFYRKANKLRKLRQEKRQTNNSFFLLIFFFTLPISTFTQCFNDVSKPISLRDSRHHPNNIKRQYITISLIITRIYLCRVARKVFYHQSRNTILISFPTRVPSMQSAARPSYQTQNLLILFPFFFSLCSFFAGKRHERNMMMKKS